MGEPARTRRVLGRGRWDVGPQGFVPLPCHPSAEAPALEPRGHPPPHPPSPGVGRRLPDPPCLCGVAWLCKALAHLCLGESMEGCQPGPGNQAGEPGGAGGAAPGPAYLGEAPAAWWVPRVSASFTFAQYLQDTGPWPGPDDRALRALAGAVRGVPGRQPPRPLRPSRNLAAWSHTAGASLGRAPGQRTWESAGGPDVRFQPQPGLCGDCGCHWPREPCPPGWARRTHPHLCCTGAWGWGARRPLPRWLPGPVAWVGLDPPGSVGRWLQAVRGPDEPC